MNTLHPADPGGHTDNALPGSPGLTGHLANLVQRMGEAATDDHAGHAERIAAALASLPPAQRAEVRLAGQRLGLVDLVEAAMFGPDPTGAELCVWSALVAAAVQDADDLAPEGGDR